MEHEVKLSIFSKLNPIVSGTSFPESPRWRPDWAQLGLECWRMQRAVGTRTQPLLTTITTLGVGPLTSRCTMPNRWLYIFESPRDAAASAAAP